MEPQLIEDVVQSVLRELQQQNTATAEPSGPATKSATPGQLRVEDAVVTEGTLTGRLSGVSEVVFSPKTVLTPSARDLLNSRKIAWTRSTSSSAGGAGSVSGPKVIVTHSTIAVGSAFNGANLVRVSPERARTAAVDSAGCGGVLVLTARPHVMAMELNRTPAMRAIAIDDPASVGCAIRESKANCVIAKPNGRSVDELQRLAKAVARCERN